MSDATLANDNTYSGNNRIALNASGNTVGQTITIPTTGTYSLCVYEASNVSGSTLALKVNGSPRASMVLPNNTTYTQQCLPNQTLNATDSAQLIVTSGGNWLNIDDTRLALIPTTPTGTLYYCYDNLNRKTSISATSNTCASPLATWSYDAGTNGQGQLTGESFTSNGVSGNYTYAYDGNGNQTNWSMTIGGTTYPFTTTYNNAQQPTTLTYPDGDVITTSYNSQDWLSGVSETLNTTTNTLLGTVNYQNAAGAAQRPSSALVANGTYQWNLNYDTLFNPIEQKVQKASSSVNLFDQTRTYDAVGNVSTVNTTLPTGTDNQMYCYDEMNRMTWAGSSGTAPCGTLTSSTLTTANYQQSYTFDTLNRLITGPTGVQVYSDPNHLDAVTSAPGYTASYDPAGNMTTHNSQPITYDALDRQTNWQNTVTGPTQTAQYAYNGEGERVQQVVTNSGTTTTTNYIGTNEEVSTTGSAVTTTKYYNAGVAVVTNVNGVLSYLIQDFLGSVTMALDNVGDVTATTLYAPYGATRYSTGTMPTARGYTSMMSDPSGLFYDHARYYDGGVGQFTSADTVQGPNRYGYVSGNPETRIDPTGQSWWDSVLYHYYHDDVNPYAAYLDTLWYGGNASCTSFRLATILEEGVTYYRKMSGPNSNQNIADAFYYMTDSEGQVAWIPQYVTTYPISGNSSDGHSEKVIMSSFTGIVNWLASWLSENESERCYYSAWRLHLVMFTEIQPCTTGPNCSAMITQTTQQLRRRLNNVGVELSVSVWWKNSPGQDPRKPVNKQVIGRSY